MATVANQIQTKQIDGRTFYLEPDGRWVDASGRAAPDENTRPDSYTNPAYEQGVTGTDPITGYVSNYNPAQLATEETTNRLAQEQGLKPGETNFDYQPISAPIRDVGGLNAGLVNETLDRPEYSSTYKQYQIDQDKARIAGQPDESYRSYYNSAPVQQAVKQSAATTNAPAKTSPADLASRSKPSTVGDSPYLGETRNNTAWTTKSNNSTTTTTTGGRINTDGLKVAKDANNSYAGTVQIDGKSVRIAVLPDGRIFNDQGQEITSQFDAKDLGSLRGAFQTASGDSTYKPGSSGQQTNTQSGNQAPVTTPNRPPYKAPMQGPGIPGGNSGSAQAPIGDYQPRETPASFRSSPGNAYSSGVKPMYTQMDTPEHENAGEGLQYKTENDRALALQRGEELNQDLGNYTDQQYAEAGDFSDLQAQAYSGIASGQGGRSGDEKNAILRQDELNSLQQTEDEANANYLSNEEEAGIRGDPSAWYSQLGKDEAGIDTASTNRDAYVRGELNRGRDATLAGLDSQDANVRRALGTQRELSNATLVGEANNARKYLDPTALNTSSEYNSAYNFGDRDMQDMVDKAGRTVGYGAAADEDRLLQDANAQGNTSPLALASARDRIRQTGAVSSADALTDARSAAKRLQLDTAQGKENTRLSAAQSYANLGTGTELNLGQDAMDMQQQLGTAEIGAESYLGDQRIKTQQALGQQATDTEKQLGQSHIDISTAGTDRNVAAGQKLDDTNSARANEIATNRQATAGKNADTRYTRGTDIYNKESAANTDFSNTRLQQEAEYRKTLADRQAQAAQATQVGNQQRGTNYGTQTSAVNAAEGNAITNYKVPSSTEKILGGIAQVVAGKKGLVTPGPRMALIGEAGPELEVEIDKLPRYGDGYNPFAADEPYGDSYLSGSGETAYEGNQLPGGTVSQNRPNPLWKNIINEMTPGGYRPFRPQQTDDQPNYNPLGKHKSGGGLLGKALSGGFNAAGLLGYADGGIVDGAQNEEIAPGISYIGSPQIKTLGGSGPTAIVPLTRRKSNVLNVEDIPKLASSYGGYGRESYVR